MPGFVLYLPSLMCRNSSSRKTSTMLYRRIVYSTSMLVKMCRRRSSSYASRALNDDFLLTMQQIICDLLQITMQNLLWLSRRLRSAETSSEDDNALKTLLSSRTSTLASSLSTLLHPNSPTRLVCEVTLVALDNRSSTLLLIPPAGCRVAVGA